MLDIPTYDDIVIIKTTQFQARSGYLWHHVKENIKLKWKYVGTSTLKTNMYDKVPVLVYTRENVFPEGGIYLKGNPIPHIITPEPINRGYIYKIDFL